MISLNVPRSFVKSIFWVGLTPCVTGESVIRELPFTRGIRGLIEFASDSTILVEDVGDSVVTEDGMYPLPNQPITRGYRFQWAVSLLDMATHRLTILGLRVFVINRLKHCFS